MDCSAIDVDVAYKNIVNEVRRTPVFHTQIDGRSMWLKLEHLQIGGSFKYRGALNSLMQLPSDVKTVIAASGGNHGVAIGLAARFLEQQAVVVVPEGAPEGKVNYIRATGAKVIRRGCDYADAEQYARELLTDDAQFIHPFSDPAIISGQGTIGIELLDQLQESCDCVVVAIGGGGLLAGVATALERSSMRVVGVEPVGVPTMRAALDAGKPVDVPIQSAAASAVGARRTCPLNLAVAQELVDDVLLVTDDSMLRAQRLLWEECRLSVEPAAALGVAAVLEGLVDAERPCVVLCGANSK